MYIVVATVAKKARNGEYSGVRQVPTFFIPERGNTLVTAETIAKAIIDPYDELRCWIQIASITTRSQEF